MFMLAILVLFRCCLLAMASFSVYLLLLLSSVLHESCTYCYMSAGLSFFIFIVTSIDQLELKGAFNYFILLCRYISNSMFMPNHYIHRRCHQGLCAVFIIYRHVVTFLRISFLYNFFFASRESSSLPNKNCA